MTLGWKKIEEFPDYEVSPSGHVIHVAKQRMMRHAYNQSGGAYVCLYYNGIQYNRSVALLVANAYLEESRLRDSMVPTPLHLDGNPANCTVDNLVWRPRWFALKYAQERKDEPFPNFKGTIYLKETDEIFTHYRTAAMKYGLLEYSIHRGISCGTQVYPLGFHFEFYA